MKGSSERDKTFIFVGSLLILISALFNEWTLSFGVESPLSVKAIRIFDVLAISTGVLLLATRWNLLRANMKVMVFSVITLTVSLIAIESTMQIASLIFPGFDVSLSVNAIPVIPVVEDEILGHRPDPDHPEHDQKGFRNRFVPDEVFIVAMGDSQTYGVNVLPDQAWPQQLEVLTKERTYNMAYGGYGPAHSLILLEEAIAMNPALIIEAFYSGNDLYDSYSLVYQRGQLPDLKTADEKIIRAIVERDINPVVKKMVDISRDSNPVAKKNGGYL